MVRFDKILRRVERKITISDDQLYKTVGVRWYGKGAFVREELLGMAIARKQQWIVRSGDVTYNKLFAWKGAFAVADGAVDGHIVSDKFPTYEVARDLVDPQLFTYYFQTSEIARQAFNLSKGAAAISKLTLNPPQFWELAMPLPPRDEQGQLLEVLAGSVKRLADFAEVRRKVAIETEALKMASMRSLRERIVKEAESVERLGTVLTITSGGTPSRKAQGYWEGDIPWIKSGELLDRDINESEEHISERAVAESSAKIFPPDTVLVAMYGQGQTRGRTGRLMLPAATNQACCALLPKPAVLSPRFVQFWLRSLYAELRLDSRAGAQPNWNASTIKAIPIAIVSVSRQLQAVAEFDELEDRLMQLASLQHEVGVLGEALRRSILEGAFVQTSD